MKLVLCEKKDQAKKIAQFMGWKDQKSYFEGSLEGDTVRVVWASGHLTRIKTPDEMVEGLDWNSLAGLTPIPRDYSLVELDDVPNLPAPAQPRTYLKRIKEQIPHCNELILATDADREGETLGWMILDYLGYRGSVRRAWLAGGLDKKTITEAFANLRPSDRTKSWYRAGEARGRSDRAFMFLVRAYTYYARYGVFGRTLGEGRGKSGVMGVGRVQTPTLAMVVRREEEIENFKPTTHYKISGLFSASGGEAEAQYYPQVSEEVIEAQPKGVTWEPSKEPPNDKGEVPLDKPLFSDKQEVEAFRERLLAHSDQARVLSYEEGNSKSQPPKTYSLADAQSDISKKLGIGAKLVQTILEDLYEQGWTSYARTSKSDLPESMYDPSERKQILGSVYGLSQVGEQAKRAAAIHDGQDSQYKPFKPSVFTSKDLEHHGIVPTAQTMTDRELENLRPKKGGGKGGPQHTALHMQKAYLLVAERFIQALYPPAEYATQAVKFQVPVTDLLGAEQSLFKANAKKLLDPGWMAAFGNGSNAESTLPTLKSGDPANIKDVMTREAVTKPPVRYSEKTLIGAMEKIAREIRDPDLRKRLKVAEGIGTPATRSQIIQTLLARNYLEEKKETLYPTARGRDLIKSVPQWMSSPETTAVWEDYLSQICEIKGDDEKPQTMRDNFVEKQVTMIEKLIDGMGEKYQGKLGERIQSGEVTPKMKKAIENVCKRTGQKVDPELLKNREKASAFLEKYIGEDAAPLPPSESQINLAKSIYDSLDPEKRPDWGELSSDSKKISVFIDENKDKRPPTKGQYDFAKKLIDQLDDADKPDPSILESFTKTSAFIDEQTKDWKKKDTKGKGKSGSKGKSANKGKAGKKSAKS